MVDYGIAAVIFITGIIQAGFHRHVPDSRKPGCCGTPKDYLQLSI